MADLGEIATPVEQERYGTLSAAGSSTYLGYRQRTMANNINGFGERCGIGDTLYRPSESQYVQKQKSWTRQIVGQTQLNGTPTSLKYVILKDGIPVAGGTSTPDIDLFRLYQGTYEIVLHGQGTKRSETWGPNTVTYPKSLEISGALTACSVSVAYSSGLTATGGNLPLTWAYSGTLPSGLSFNTTTGVISGTTAAAGSYKLCISATGADNIRVFKDVILVVS